MANSIGEPGIICVEKPGRLPSYFAALAFFAAGRSKNPMCRSALGIKLLKCTADWSASSFFTEAFWGEQKLTSVVSPLSSGVPRSPTRVKFSVGRRHVLALFRIKSTQYGCANDVSAEDMLFSTARRVPESGQKLASRLE